MNNYEENLSNIATAFIIWEHCFTLAQLPLKVVHYSESSIVAARDISHDGVFLDNVPMSSFGESSGRGLSLLFGVEVGDCSLLPNGILRFSSSWEFQRHSECMHLNC